MGTRGQISRDGAQIRQSNPKNSRDFRPVDSLGGNYSQGTPIRYKLPWNNHPRKLLSAGDSGGTAARISVSHTGSRTAPRHQCPNADCGPGQTCIRATRTTARTASLPETNTLYTIPRTHAASCCSLRVRAPAPPGWKLPWNNHPRKLLSAGDSGGTAARISVSHTGSRTAPRHQCPNADCGPGQTCIRATRTTARTASLPETNTFLITYQAHLARSTAWIAPWGACNGRRIGPNGLHDAMSVARIRFPCRCGAWNMRFVRNQEHLSTRFRERTQPRVVPCASARRRRRGGNLHGTNA